MIMEHRTNKKKNKTKRKKKEQDANFYFASQAPAFILN